MRRITRAGLRGIGLLVATGALAAAAVVPATAAEPGTTWQPDLSKGHGTGIVVVDGTARFDAATAHGAPREGGSGTEASADPSGVVPTGLLTLPPRSLEVATTEVEAVLDAETPPGSSATIDVRGRRADGAWTEWVPAGEAAPGRPARVELPAAAREVQGRVVLTATGEVTPTVREVTLTAAPASMTESAPQIEAAPLSYSVFATREGLVGGTTANGHTIVERDRFVALPSRRALSANGKSDYSVKVCAPNGRCAFAPVWDVGPWNTKDDYWNPSSEREMWKDLPQGVPQAAAAFHDGHNGGRDQFGRRPSNPAGIDLADGIFWDVLGLKDNSQVQVTYLWTGSQRLSAVAVEGAVDVDILAEPRAGAEVVGTAANTTDVPVHCVHGEGADGFVRIGDGQYLPLTAFATAPEGLPRCDGAGAPAGPDPAAGDPGTGDPAADAPASGTPAPGAAAPGPPASGSPAADAPAASTPGTGSTGTGSTGTGSTGADAPASDDPGSGAAAPDAPAPGAPAPGAPAPGGDAGGGDPGASDPTAPTGNPGGSSPGPTGTGDPGAPAPDANNQAAVVPGSAQRAPSGRR